MSQYAGGASSTIESSDTVTTAVVKTGPSPLVTKNGLIAPPSDDVVIFNETVGNVTSQCYFVESEMNYTKFAADRKYNLSLIIEGSDVRFLFADNFTVSNINMHHSIEVASHLTLEINTNPSTWKCDSSVRFDICTVSLGLRSRDVHVLQNYSSDSTVNLSTFSRLMKQSIGAPESVFSDSLLAKAGMLDNNATDQQSLEEGVGLFLVNFYSNFAQGLFSTGQKNLLHAKVATAVADGLTRFHTLQLLVNDKMLDPGAIARESFTLDQLRTWGLTAPVYGLQLQAYIPTRYVWALVGALLLVAWISAMVGLLSLVAAPINVKSANDISLMHCVESKSLAARAAEVINALLTCLQNDLVIA